MSSLAELIGFFSYSREDDEAFEGTLSALRDSIQRELSAQLGRSRATFRLWQDQAAIAPGQLWESEIKTAVEQAVFFIPIVTPRAVNSHHCKFEFEAFLARERTLDRTDLVFPLLYISVPALENEAQWRKDPVLSIIGTRQYVDWRPFRHLDVRTTAVREAIERFCNKIVEALIKPWVSPEERRKQQQTEAQQRAEAARQAEEEKQRAEAARQAEEEKQRAKAARLVDEEKRRAQAARQAEEKRRPAEAARQAEDEPRRDRRPRRRSGETRPLGATANLAENDWIASFLRKDEKGFTISIRKGQESHVLELEITARLRDHLLLNQKIIKSYFTFGKRKEIITLPGHDDTIILEFVARD